MKSCRVSFFVTLTYNDEHLPFTLPDGTYVDVPCLCKRDLQLHFKRLRKRLEPKTVKYFAVGEHGDRGARPHYHYLIFYYGEKDRFELMNLIKDSWLDENGEALGFTQVLPINGAQGYVTKYVLKFDKRDHPVKPFSLISHGLGANYLSSSMIRYHRDNLIPYGVKPGGYRVSLPRYYKDKIFSMYDRLVMKKRADLRRHELDVIRLDKYDLMLDSGINPFKESVSNYQNRLYQSIKLYNQKKKL